MNKKKKLGILTISPILIELAALLFLPAQIPIHYNMQFQPDRYGSKYMLLILGVITIMFGTCMLWLYHVSEKRAYEKLVYRLGVITMLLFHVINIAGILGAFLK